LGVDGSREPLRLPVWTWTAIDADTKLAVTCLLGDRSTGTAKLFMTDLARSVTGRVQITSDGDSACPEAAEEAFGSDVGSAQLQKIYAGPAEGQKRYNYPECVGCKVSVV
jgi:hypothetical protein